MVVSKATLPAWCNAASGMGTRYNRVEMPRRTWIFAIANADVAILWVNGGSAARKTGLKVEAYRAAVAKYVVTAYRKAGEEERCRKDYPHTRQR